MIRSGPSGKPSRWRSFRSGGSGGLRGGTTTLVFAELHAVTIRDSVSFVGAWGHFDEAGALFQPERAERSMTKMLARLRWWATALNRARNHSPYPAAV